MDKFFDLNVTYGDVERALLKLGFSLTIAEPHRLYYHEATASVFGTALDIPLAARVRPAHLSSVRHAVVGMGVADQETFEKLLTASDDPVRVHANGNGRARRIAVAASPIEAGQTQSR